MSGHNFQPRPVSRLRQLLLRHSPILSSLAIHATILLLAFTTYTVGKQVVNRTQEQPIIPDALIIPGADVGAIPKPSLGADPTRNATQADAPEAASDAWTKPSRALQAAIMNPAAGDARSAIGAGNQTLAAAGLMGADGASAAPFGAPAPVSASAPKSTFMGVSGNAKKIIYICDASGSMVGLKFQALKVELEKSVRDLVPIQSFNVIFFNEERPIMLTRDLVPANSHNKSQLLAFLTGAEPRRGSDPIPSLRYAMLQKPDLIYLLTDGDFLRDGNPINAQVLRELQWLNRDKHTKFNTIAFPGADTQRENQYIDTLKQIASDSGGIFRSVSSADLNQSVR